MNKKRFLIVFSLLIVATILLGSCAQKIPAANSFSVALNADYKPERDKTTTAVEISELSGYKLVESKGEFMVFANYEGETVISRAIFSARNKRVVLVIDSSTGGGAEIKLTSSTPAFTVVRTSILCADSNDVSVSCELYDAMGTLVDTVSGAESTPILFADTLIFNNTSFSIDEKSGRLTKIAQTPENLYVESCSDWNDKYFYTYDDVINVYDREFRHVYSWTIPSWGEYLSRNTLNDGRVLVQYTRPLDINVDDYDLYEMDENTGETKKFDVYTSLLDPEKRTEKEIKLDYIVSEITTGGELIRTSGNDGLYRNDVDNIAYIYRIDNSQIDYSDTGADVVLMDNNARIKKSLKVIDDQKAALPTCIGENLYLASTVYGMAIVDVEGNVLHQINNTTISVVGDNIVSEDKIYTLNMEEVYSLYNDGGDIVTYLDGTVFLKKGTLTDYSIIAINGSQKKEISKYDAFDINAVTFTELSDVACYELANVAKGSYSYYNSNHELLLSLSARLERVATDYGSGVGIYSANVDNQVKYYAFY